MIKVQEEDKSYYYAFLESLVSIANPEFPGKLWTDSEGKECYASFDEMVMDYLDFCEVILTWPIFNPNQKEKLQDLYEMVDNYDYYLDERTKTDDEICNDLEWHKIRTFAKEVYDDLKQVKYVPNEND
ncbi:MAG: hypothetical protein KFB93_04150 [Simkaniaceae bacterium]|nr:MAG: hypothetical protein KFB93_04150 [Simkaniaceae bacterium]